ncbi:hypothetical protein [Paractinoplanes maris]|uniref:hypothetical protein n=1 Tax=Paractinoplanes maris TaxID=1734446 RepID=UPI0020218932|nr:hypothetical protein [Actinoplanes maris]
MAELELVVGGDQRRVRGQALPGVGEAPVVLRTGRGDRDPGRQGAAADEEELVRVGQQGRQPIPLAPADGAGEIEDVGSRPQLRNR